MVSARVDEILESIRKLPVEDQRELLQRAERDLPASTGSLDPLAFVGMYSDEPELIDAICEDAMRARERDPLRLEGG